MQQYSPTGFKVLPPIVKNLLIINGLMFLATFALGNSMGIDLNDYLGLRYFESTFFKPYQLITYMFMHGNINHIFFNMFALWMFGSVIENYWGPKRFLIFYFVTGIGAGLMQMGVNYFEISQLKASMSAEQINLILNEGQSAILEHKNFIDSSMAHLNSLMNSTTVGASGAVFGLLLAFGMLFPNSLIYMYFLFPIKAKWFVIGYGAIELYMGFNGSTDGIAHFAHLGGMLFGLFLILYWKQKDKDKFLNQF
ncbi:MAG: rhomboid family intramembrane serine protease [Bacteroidota bacterium]